jgi:hypothetical protein
MIKKRQYTEWKKIFSSYTFNKGLIARAYRKLKKVKLPKSQGHNGQMNQIEIFQRKKSKWAKIHEEMLNIPSQKGNANQNYLKIPPHSYLYGSYQNYKQ